MVFAVSATAAEPNALRRVSVWRAILILGAILLAAAALCLALPHDYAQAAGNTSKVYVKGTFYANKTGAALDRVNAIRKEACEQGVPDPRDESRKLTPSDYKPIKWSTDMEEIARQRAAEACVFRNHQRPDNSDIWSLESSVGLGTFGENLAWNWCSSGDAVLYGVEQWYGEKADWVKQTADAVTGHYTSLIDPSFSHIGLACFISDCGPFEATVTGEFLYDNLADPQNLATSRLPTEKDSNREITVANSYIESLSVSAPACPKKTFINGKSTTLAAMMQLRFPTNPATCQPANVNWSSSNTKRLKVSASGKLTSAGVGKCTIQASALGKSAKISFTVAPKATSLKKVKAGKKSFKAYWKKSVNANASGYQIRWSTSKKMSKAKSATVKGYKASSKTIKKLKAKKKYYVQVRVFKKADGKTYYSSWSAAKKVKTK